MFDKVSTLVLLIFVLISCNRTSEKYFYLKRKEVEIKSKVYSAYFDEESKGRYVLILKNEKGFYKLRNTYLQAAHEKIKKGDSIYKPKDSLKYYVYRNDEKDREPLIFAPVKEPFSEDWPKD